MQRVSGLETWFELPGRTAPAPPRWKMFLVSLVGHLPAAARGQHRSGRRAPGRGPARVLFAAAVTAAMTWLVMPRAARLLQNWLYAPPPAALKDSGLTAPRRERIFMPHILVSASAT